MQLPLRRYHGPVSLVASTQEAARALREIERESVVGLDTETRPTFKKGDYHPPSLLQIATAHRVYLFQLLQLRSHDALVRVLENPGIVKAGVALAHDLAMLRNGFPFQEKCVIDLGDVARHHGSGQAGIRTLAGLCLGFRISKGGRTSNWANPRLTESQIIYAATDAWVSRELYLHFQKAGLID